MKTITIALFVILLGGRSVTAQTLQQVTDNGATTNNGISVAQVTANAPSFSGRNLPSNIDFLNGFRINGSIADASHNGITYQSWGGGGAAISFFRGGSYDTGMDFYTNIDNIPGNLQHRMRIASNGNVGIGTTDPKASLHVMGTIRWGEDNTNYLYSGQDGSGAYFEQVGTDANKSEIRFQTSRNGNLGAYSQFKIDPEKGFSFVNTGSGSSNVGIGTSDTKGYKLAVAGNMIAESIKVQLQGSWPDYVFTKSYQLPSLQEIEKHIKDKGHLPGIPSAAEVKANGIDLGEMNAKLLQKVEEITLHLINKDKEIAILKQQIQEQNANINLILSKIY